MQVSASVTSGDLSRLAEMAIAAEAGGADRIHLDIEDGLFTPLFTVGPSVVAAIRRATRLPLEVHIQTMNPHRWIATAAAGRPDRIIVHLEGTSDLAGLLRAIAEAGIPAGLALLLVTPAEAAMSWLGRVSQVTLMSTTPKGGRFRPEVLDKARLLRGLIGEIAVDGGVNRSLIPRIAAAGITTVVAGRAIFGRGTAHVSSGIAALRGAA